MPFNGSGTYSRLYSWVVDAANAVNISSSRTDAEMNGFAAGLTNCITRDGQSPPSADLPMGGKKLVNLGAATVGTDALNRDTADARYISIVGDASFPGNLTLSTWTKAFTFTDQNGGHPTLSVDGSNNLTLAGTDASGNPRSIWFVGMHSGSSGVTFAVPVFGVTPTGGDNSTKIATTAYVVGALGSYATLASPPLTGTPTAPTAAGGTNTTQIATTAFVAASFAPLASPALTGTPTAPTAASGTATTQVATTAFVDALRDVPSNYYTTSQTVGTAHRGQSADFNGASLTATIAAGLSNGYACQITNLNASALTIASAADTMYLGGTVTTGNRTLAQNGMVTVVRKNGVLIVAGSGLS